MILYIFLAVCFISNPAEGFCQDRWIQFGDSCYGLIEDDEGWAQAKYLCESRDAHLVTIESAAENDFVKSYARKQAVVTDVWIGASDIWAEGIFRWVGSDTNMTFTDWNAGEPNSISDDENCAELENSVDYLWNDDECTKQQHFMCETRFFGVVVG